MINRIFTNLLVGDGMGFDTVIRNGKIVDGTGSPWFRGDLAIKSGNIAYVDRVDASEAEEVIDAESAREVQGFYTFIIKIEVIKDHGNGKDL